MNRFREKSKTFDFGPKNGPFASFWAHQEFSIKIENCYFYQLFNAFNQTQFKKNLMNRLQKSSRTLILGIKIDYLNNFGQNKNFFKKELRNFLVFNQSQLHAKVWIDDQKNG